MIAGSLTGWKYTPMFTIEEFVMMLDSDYERPPDHLIENRGLAKGGQAQQAGGGRAYDRRRDQDARRA